MFKKRGKKNLINTFHGEWGNESGTVRKAGSMAKNFDPHACWVKRYPYK